MSEGRFFGRFRGGFGEGGGFTGIIGGDGGGLAGLEFLAVLDFLDFLELLELPEEPALAEATRRPRITLYIDRGRRGREKRMWG